MVIPFLDEDAQRINDHSKSKSGFSTALVCLTMVALIAIASTVTAFFYL